MHISDHFCTWKLCIFSTKPHILHYNLFCVSMPKHKLSTYIFHIYAQLKHPDMHTPAYPCLSQ